MADATLQAPRLQFELCRTPGVLCPWWLPQVWGVQSLDFGRSVRCQSTLLHSVPNDPLGCGGSGCTAFHFPGHSKHVYLAVG